MLQAIEFKKANNNYMVKWAVKQSTTTISLCMDNVDLSSTKQGMSNAIDTTLPTKYNRKRHRNVIYII